MNWLVGIAIDIIILLIVVVFYKIGAKNGFAKTVVRFLGLFIALAIASLLSGPLAQWSYNSFVKQPVEEAIARSVRENVDKVNADEAFSSFEKTIDSLPQIVKNAVSLDKYEQQIKTQLKDVTEDGISRVSKDLTAKVVEPAALVILKMIAFFVLFAVISIVVAILSSMLGIVNKIPLLGSVNKLLGGIIGILQGFLVILIVTWLMSTYIGRTGSLFGVINQQVVDSSFIFQLFMENNPIGMLLLKQN